MSANNRSILDPAQCAELKEHFTNIGLNRARFGEKMEELGEKRPGYAPVKRSAANFLKIWDALFNKTGTIQNPLMASMAVTMVESIRPPDQRAAQAQRSAINLLKLLLPKDLTESDVGAQDESDPRPSSHCVRLITVDHKGKLRRGAKAFVVYSSQEIGCALDEAGTGLTPRTKGIVPCSQLGKVHRRFARIDWAEGGWSITCLPHTKLPLEVNGKSVPAGTTHPISHGQIITLAKDWNYLVEDQDRRITFVRR